jgi:hypothetical protein
LSTAAKAARSIPRGGKDALGPLVPVKVIDPAADALAERLGGRARVAFRDGPPNEFDVVTDHYVCQTKPDAFAQQGPGANRRRRPLKWRCEHRGERIFISTGNQVETYSAPLIAMRTATMCM